MQRNGKNGMGKTRDLFKKIGDVISCKMGMVKDRKGKDLTETEEIKKRWHRRIHRRTVQKKASMTWITTMVWSLI